MTMPTEEDMVIAGGRHDFCQRVIYLNNNITDEEIYSNMKTSTRDQQQLQK